MKARSRVIWCATVLVSVVLCAGCGSRVADRYYALSSLAGDGGQHLESRGVPQRWQVIGVGPIVLPGYLDHPSVTIRRDDSTLLRSEVHRWGGSLRDEVSRVVVENLGYLLSPDRFLVLPWMEAPTGSLRVQIAISRFEGTEAKTVILNGSWLLFGEERTAPLAAATEEVRESIDGDEYHHLVAAMSSALAEMSRRIAGRMEATDIRQSLEQETKR